MSTTAGTPENKDSDAVHTDRWRRRVGAGDALSSSEALRLSEEEADRIAKRADRAAKTAQNEPVSIRDNMPIVQGRDTVQPVEPLTVDEFSVGETEIDLREGQEEIDVRQMPAPPSMLATPTTYGPPPATMSAGNGASSGSGASKTPGTGSSSSQVVSAETSEVSSTKVIPEPSNSAAADTVVPSANRPPIRHAEIDPDEFEPIGVEPAAGQSNALERRPGTAIERLVPDRPARSAGPILLLIAVSLAIVTGILGTMLLRERSSSTELRDQVERAEAGENVAVAGLEEVNGDVRVLELENDRLQQQLNEMSALVLELPEGRLTEIAVPFTPLFADEAANGRLIAISAEGEYIIWGDGAAGPITDSGTLSGAPTGLFAATGKAWVSTDNGQVEALSLVAGADGLPAVDVGNASFLAQEERSYWTFDSGTGEVVRRRKGDSSVLTSVSIPVDVVDMTIGAGSVWALGDDGRVYRINTADLTVLAIDAGADLISITAGPDALWTLSAADGSLRRVDPVTGEVLVTVPVGRDPIDATFGGGSVWVPLRSGSSLIEVDTRTAAVVSRTPLPGEPTAVHQGETGVFITAAGDSPMFSVSSSSAEQAEAAESTDDS